MSHKSLLIGAFLCTLCYAFEATAMPRIVAIEEKAMESAKISITLNADNRTGTATAEECSMCPLQLDIDENTSFFFNHEKVDRDKVKSHSGKAGVIFFKKERTTRIRWWR